MWVTAITATSSTPIESSASYRWPIDRDGPQSRVEHGVSGFRSNDYGELADYVEQLVLNRDLRRRIAGGARNRAREFDPQQWTDNIVGSALGY